MAGVLLGGHAAIAKRHKRKPRKRTDEDDGAPTSCYPGEQCVPGRGRTNAGCDFTGSTVFRNLDARGSILSGANFTGADLSGATLLGANLSDACLLGADLTGALIDNSTNLHRALFCQTMMPDGSILNAGCNQPTPCCNTGNPPTGTNPGRCRTLLGPTRCACVSFVGNTECHLCARDVDGQCVREGIFCDCQS